MNNQLINNPYYHIKNIYSLKPKQNNTFLYQVDVNLNSTKTMISNSIKFIFGTTVESINTKIEKYPKIVDKRKRTVKLFRKKIAIIKTKEEIMLINFISMFGDIKNIVDSGQNEKLIDESIENSLEENE